MAPTISEPLKYSEIIAVDNGNNNNNKLPFSPTEFYEKYVKRRRPVLFKGFGPALHPKIFTGCDDNTASKSSTISLDKLLEIVGDDHRNDLVEVNQYNQYQQEPQQEQGSDGNDNNKKRKLNNNNNSDESNAKKSFSPQHSTVITMPFDELCNKLQQDGSNNYYMTTQTLPIDEEGKPGIYTTPVTQLIDKGLVPLRAKSILGNLIPMTCNLWIGRTTSSNSAANGTDKSSSSSSSSGLHHDFHDNLYCLWRGSKTFRIAPPSSVHKLQMSGTLKRLYSNGRIVYEEQLDDNETIMIRPDGALDNVERIMELEIRKEQIEEQLLLQDDGGSSSDNNDKLEKELNAIEEELLDIEMNNTGDGNNNAGGDEDADLLFGGGGGDDGEQDEDEDDDDDLPSRAEKKRKTTDPDDDQEDELPSEEKSHSLPCNFVVGNNSDQKVEFETIHMVEGDMLYLPAGWFHEVTSSSSPGSNNNNNKEGNNRNDDNLHFAFNYWVHPPDVDDDDDDEGADGGAAAAATTTGSTTSKVNFDKPYLSKFWQRDWEARNLE